MIGTIELTLHSELGGAGYVSCAGLGHAGVQTSVFWFHVLEH